MKTKFKAVLTLVLAFVMVLGLVACNDDPTPSTNPSAVPSVEASVAPTTNPSVAPEAPTPTEAASATPSEDEGTPSTEPSEEAPAPSEEAPEPTPEVPVYPSTELKEGEYTINSTFSLSPKTWNPHTWEDNSDSIILGYTTMGFYDVQLNANKDGYEFVPEMAAAFPVDVTSTYVGQYGVKEGDTRKAWKIALNPNAKWETGEAITADDYLYSMKEQLNPYALNRRSDSYTTGNFTIYGASNYLYSNTPIIYKTPGALGYESGAAAFAAGVEVLMDVYSAWGAAGYVDAEGNPCPQYLPIDDETEYDTPDSWAGDPVDRFTAAQIYAGYASVLEDGYLFIAVENTNQDDNFDHVGLVKTGDYEIVIILETAIDDFNIKYNLTSNWLVHEETYEACKVTTDSGLVSSTYGTAMDKYVGYGPYSLTSYSLDQYFELTKNDTWYGYTDNNHVGQYQTTRIAYTFMTEHATVMEQFLLGKVDSVGLLGEEMAKYGNSDYRLEEPESYTYQFFLCTNLQKLQERDTDEVNHSVLSLQSFRKAFSFAIDRAAYCAEFDPASNAGFGLLNYLYTIDPNTGALYRETDDAKRVSLKLQGYTENEDGTWKDYSGFVYDTLEDAYESITGYDVEYARELFQQAYEEAVADGLLKPGQVVQIDRGATSESATGKAMIAQFNGFLAEATKGTGFEGKVSLVYNTKYSSNDAFWAAVKAGDLDLAFAGWGGAAMDPFGIVYSCYLDTANCFSPLFRAEADAMDITIEINGEEITAKMTDWAKWLANYQKDEDYITMNLVTKLGLLADADLDVKVKILSEIEYAELNTFNNLPIFYSVVNSLNTAKWNNGADTYLGAMIGYGGIRHITFNYDDVEWAEFVESQGGNLDTLYAG